MIGTQPVGFVNGKLTDFVTELRPQIVLGPFPDRHIDHRVVFESLMVATRPRGAGREIELLAAYETLSETHWNAPQVEPNFVPNMVVDVTAQIERKIKALKCYESQIQVFPEARSVEAVEALAKFRGTQAGFAFGEGLQIIRMIG
jgi:LmbE family N-acetylglucosaminyl deacetylase